MGKCAKESGGCCVSGMSPHCGKACPIPEHQELCAYGQPERDWQYYLNDEGRARWRCPECGKVCRRNPHDKRYCSSCGARLRMAR